MRKFTCSPTLEILGQNIIAWEHNLQDDETRPIMEKYGLVNLDPDKWYPCIQLLNAMNDMAENPNTVSNFVAIGMEIGRIVPVPPQFTDPSLGDVLMAWDGIYQYLHRNGDAGKINCEKLADNHYRITFTDLYPDDFSYGIMYSYAKRFLPAGTNYMVYYDPALVRRDEGDTTETVIHVSWE